MKKLLIHIGYPKTATTTFQESLFVKLHKKKKIKYLGKTENGRFHQESGSKVNFGKIIPERFLRDDSLNDIKISLSSEKLNLFSSEWLIALDWQLQKNKLCDSKKLEKFKKFFQSLTDDLEILIVLRTQQSLIYSLFVESYGSLIKNKKLNTFDKFLSYNFNNKNCGFFPAFYFSDVLEQYTNHFDKEKIHILLFEDFVNDKKHFIQELSKIMNINVDIIENSLKNEHHNRGKKWLENILYEQKEQSYFGKFVQLINSYHLIPPSAKKFYRTNEKIKTIFSKMSNKKKAGYLIPKQTDKQKELIYKKYKKNNSKLVKKFGIDEKKLKKYGYI